MARKMKNVENETQTLYDLNMVRKAEKRGKRDTKTVLPGLWQEN